MTGKPMTQSDVGIVEKLERNARWRNEKSQCVTDPAMLTEAAAIITEMVEAMTLARAHFVGLREVIRQCNGHDSLIAETAIENIDATLAKVSGK